LAKTKGIYIIKTILKGAFPIMAALSHMTSDKMILNATLVFILNVSPKFEVVVPNFKTISYSHSDSSGQTPYFVEIRNRFSM